MAGLLILLLIFIFLFILFLQDNNFKIAFVKTILSFTLFQFIITELLSILNKIDFFFYVITYLCFLIILIFILYKKRNRKLSINYQIIRFIIRAPKIYRVIFGFLFINIAIIIFTSLFYPPNNADAVTCWLARVEHWISNKTLSYYPTHNHLQNVHQPLSSIIFLNIRLLTNTDLFLNLTQLIFLFSISFILIEIIKKEFKPIKFQIVNLIITFSIPLIILQASSSKNDLIVSFFFISSCYFLIKVIESNNFFNILWFSISVALGILTKFSIIPFLVVFIIYYLIKILINNYRKAILVFLTSLAIVIFLSTPYFIRNYNYCGNILGNVQVSDLRDFQTEMRGTSQSNIFKRSISVITKYFGYALSNPITKTNSKIEKLVHKFDSFLNLNEQEVLHSDYTLESANLYSEDCKNNFIFFIFILLSIPFVFKQKNLLLKEFLILSIISFLSFCFIFPIYDIARGRYMIPLILLLTIQLSYFIVTKFNKFILVIFLVFLMISTLYVSYKNHSKTFLPVNEIIQSFKFYTKHIPTHFTNKEEFYNLYNKTNIEERRVIDKIYDKDGNKKNQNITMEENLYCFNVMVKYKILINPNYASFRKGNYSKSIEEKKNEEMVDCLQKLKIKEIGLYSRKDFREFSLWCALNANEMGIKIEAVKVDDQYIYHKDFNFKPQVIIVYERPDYYKYFNDFIEYKKFDDVILLINKKMYLSE